MDVIAREHGANVAQVFEDCTHAGEVGDERDMFEVMTTSKRPKRLSLASRVSASTATGHRLLEARECLLGRQARSLQKSVAEVVSRRRHIVSSPDNEYSAARGSHEIVINLPRRRRTIDQHETTRGSPSSRENAGTPKAGHAQISAGARVAGARRTGAILELDAIALAPTGWVGRYAPSRTRRLTAASFDRFATAMCMIVYIASRSPLPLISWQEDAPAFNVTALNPDEQPVLRHLALPQVRQAGSHTGCGCGFNEGREYPEACEDAAAECADAVESSARLARYVREHRVQRIYSCWSGGEGEPPAFERRVTPERLVAPDFFFRDGELLTIDYDAA